MRKYATLCCMFLSGGANEVEGLVRIVDGTLAVLFLAAFPIALDLPLTLGMADVNCVGSYTDHRTVDTMELA